MAGAAPCMCLACPAVCSCRSWGAAAVAAGGRLCSCNGWPEVALAGVPALSGSTAAALVASAGPWRAGVGGPSAPAAPAGVGLSLSAEAGDGSSWEVLQVGHPCDGNAMQYDPIKSEIVQMRDKLRCQ